VSLVRTTRAVQINPQSGAVVIDNSSIFVAKEESDRSILASPIRVEKRALFEDFEQ